MALLSLFFSYFIIYIRIFYNHFLLGLFKRHATVSKNSSRKYNQINAHFIAKMCKKLFVYVYIFKHYLISKFNEIMNLKTNKKLKSLLLKIVLILFLDLFLFKDTIFKLDMGLIVYNMYLIVYQL